jgi:hypothetical protein
MRFRTLALALALSCGLTSLAVAKQRPAIHKVKPRKTKARKNTHVKTSKVKVSKRRAKH